MGAAVENDDWGYPTVTKKTAPTRVAPLLVLLLLVLGTTLGTTIDAQEVFAPFPSHIRVAVRDPLVRVSWRDSVDLPDAAYRVYRHTERITSDNLAAATFVGEAPPDAEQFLDVPDAAGEYYYAVIAVGTDGTQYPLVVELRNTIVDPIRISQTAQEEELAASVTGLAASVAGLDVRLSFRASRPTRMLAVYRSTRPLADVQSLAEAVLLGRISAADRYFDDQPIPGIDYYYAVVDSGLVETGGVELSVGENSLSAPVQVALVREPVFDGATGVASGTAGGGPTGDAAAPGEGTPIGDGAAATVDATAPRASGLTAGQDSVTTAEIVSATAGVGLRRRPLPFVSPAVAFEALMQSEFGISTLPKNRGTATAEVEAALTTLLGGPVSYQLPSPQPATLPEDVVENDVTGAERNLRQVLASSYRTGDWPVAQRQLEALLTLPLSDELEGRVSFYLGVVLYEQDRLKEAFFRFLLVGATYESEADIWIDAILAREAESDGASR